MKQEFINMNIQDVYIIRPESDISAQLISYMSYSKNNFKKSGLSFSVENEWNYLIRCKGLLQGLYINTSESKLVQVFSGSVYLVLADTREHSLTEDKLCHVHLTSHNFWSLYLPRNVAYGILNTGEESLINFKSSESKKSDSIIPFNEEKWNFIWPLKELGVKKIKYG